MNRFMCMGLALALCSISGFADQGVTTSEFKDGDTVYKTISFDGRFIVYSNGDALSYHDRSSTDWTFRVDQKNERVSYAFLSEAGDIDGFVSDLDQDGTLDIKFWNRGQIDVWFENNWHKKEKDDLGDFVLLNGGRIQPRSA